MAPMSNIRPHILRQYIDTIYGGRGATSKAVEGATVSEYLALVRMRCPEYSSRRLLECAPTPELRALANQFEPHPPPVAQPLPRERTIQRCAACDLRRAEIDPAIKELDLISIKSVSGWEALRNLRQLDYIQLIECKSAEKVSLSPRLSVRILSVDSCDSACFETIIRSTSAEIIDVHHTATPTLDLGIFRGHTHLRELDVSALLVRRVERVAGLPIESFAAKNFDPSAEFRAGLATLAPTLKRLYLGSSRPIGPDLLPDLPHLEHLEVTGHPEFKEAWLDYAVAHPHMGYDFTQGGREIPTSDHAIDEIYRGVDIIRISGKKKMVLEVSGDLAGEILDTTPGWEGDNYTLEEMIRSMAKKAKKKGISWSSESGTLVVHAPDVETCRWIIDRIFEIAGRGR